MKTLRSLFLIVIALVSLGQGPVRSDWATLKSPQYALYTRSESELEPSRRDLDFAVSQFKHYFGEPPPAISIFIFDSPEELAHYDLRPFLQPHQRYLAWLSPAGLAVAHSRSRGSGGDANTNGNTGQPPAPVDRDLSHEAGHIFLLSWMDRRIMPSMSGASYGHLTVPAWFSEAVAMLNDSPEVKKRQYDFLKQHTGAPIPLPELFSMRHPASGNQARTQIGAGMFISSLAGSEQWKLFYAESFTFAEFMAAKEGPLFIRQVAEGLAQGLTMTDILREAKNVSSEPAKLSAAWQSWVADQQ